MSTWAENEVTLPLCVVIWASPSFVDIAGPCMLLVHVPACERATLASSRPPLCTALIRQLQLITLSQPTATSWKCSTPPPVNTISSVSTSAVVWTVSPVSPVSTISCKPPAHVCHVESRWEVIEMLLVLYLAPLKHHFANFILLKKTFSCLTLYICNAACVKKTLDFWEDWLFCEIKNYVYIP